MREMEEEEVRRRPCNPTYHSIIFVNAVHAVITTNQGFRVNTNQGLYLVESSLSTRKQIFTII